MLYEKLLDKYFSKHSLDHSYKQNKNVKNKKYNYFVVIPVYNEYDFIFETLESINNNNELYLKDVLVVLVINNSINDSEYIRKTNSKTYQALKKHIYRYMMSHYELKINMSI